MKIEHIYITKEGEPMANPEMEYPENPKDKEPVPKIQKIWKHGEDLEKYHSGLLPFEDKRKVKELILNTICAQKDKTGQSIGTSTLIDSIIEKHLQPDTLIPVDLEVEVVEIRTLNGKPCGDGSIIPNEGDCLDFTKFLRIKP